MSSKRPAAKAAGPKKDPMAYEKDGYLTVDIQDKTPREEDFAPEMPEMTEEMPEMTEKEAEKAEKEPEKAEKHAEGGIVDGKDAVQFLVRLKELLEDPTTLLLEG